MDERGLTISVQKSTLTLFTAQFAQSSTHPQVTLNKSLLPLKRTGRKLGVTFDTYFKFWTHVESIVICASSRINIIKALAVTNWGHPSSPLYPLSDPFLCMQFPFGSPKPHHPWFRNFILSKTLPFA